MQPVRNCGPRRGNAVRWRPVIKLVLETLSNVLQTLLSGCLADNELANRESVLALENLGDRIAPILWQGKGVYQLKIPFLCLENGLSRVSHKGSALESSV